MATTIATGYANAPLKQGEPPERGFIYSGKGIEFDGVADYVNLTSINWVSNCSISKASIWSTI